MAAADGKLRHLEVSNLHHEVERPTGGLLSKLIGTSSLKETFHEGESSQADQWRTILDGVTLNLYAGEIMAVMGSSGSGKTSLLDLIACRNDSASACRTTGAVLFNGRERTEASVKSMTAYVRQDDRLVAQLSVRETLRFVAEMKLPKAMTSEEKSAQVEAVINELGLWHVAEHRVGSVDQRGLSGGERRRVSIGVQMLLDPQLLLLDEPTSAHAVLTPGE